MIIYTVFGEEEVLTQICIVCGVEKPLSAFAIDTCYLTKIRHRSDCKECQRKNSKVAQRLHKEAPPKPERCEGCGKIPKKWALDHDHETEEFRGWLCISCNRALAMMGDTKEGVLKLLGYLERYEKNRG